MCKALLLDTQRGFRLQAVLGFLLSFFVSSALAVTAYYQPTPYPAAVPLQYHHLWDGWLNNFSPQLMTFQQNDFLQIGGSGDTYRTYIRFDATGLPRTVSSAQLWLMPGAQAGAMPQALIYRVDGSWDAATTPARASNPATNATTAMTWATQPAATSYLSQPAPILNAWWKVDITAPYNEWMRNSLPNFGIRIDPQVANSPTQSIVRFRSSRYADFVTDQCADGKRPLLQLDFTPPVIIPDFKIPLPGNHAWRVATEIGGTDCVGPVAGTLQWPDPAHTGLDYFSIDFSAVNRPDKGATVFSATQNQQGDIVTNIPILAAASGLVAAVGTSNLDGNYIVLNHGGVISESANFTTRYLHLAALPARQDKTLLKKGDQVVQGDQIGFMGSTGTTRGAHLQFGVRYGGSGSNAVPELSYVVMDGWLLKSFQTECDATRQVIRYYRSENRVY